MTETSSVHIQQSQSSFWAERESEQLRREEGSRQLQLFNHVTEPSAIALGRWNNIVVWGVGGTLLDMSDNVIDAMVRRSFDGLVKCGVKVGEHERKSIESMARYNYERDGVTSSLLACTYNVAETRLLAETVSEVLTHDFSTDPGKYGLANQGDLNMFEDSRNKGIKHMALTSAPSFFARSILHYRVLAYLFDAIGGHETAQLPNGQVPNKRTHGGMMLSHLLRDVAEDRMKDVIVVDHGIEYLNAAHALGCRTVFLNRSGRELAGDARHAHAASVRSVFEDILGVPFRSENRREMMTEREIGLTASPK